MKKKLFCSPHQNIESHAITPTWQTPSFLEGDTPILGHCHYESPKVHFIASTPLNEATSLIWTLSIPKDEFIKIRPPQSLVLRVEGVQLVSPPKLVYSSPALLCINRTRKKSRDRGRERSKSRERWRSKSRERKRDRSKSKDRGRDRSRSREKGRERSRSRERGREKSRSKERGHERSRSKERGRNQSRERGRDRSRSKERKIKERREKDRSPVDKHYSKWERSPEGSPVNGLEAEEHPMSKREGKEKGGKVPMNYTSWYT